MQKTTLSLVLAAAAVLLINPCLYYASAEGLDADVATSERTYRNTKDGAGALSKEMIKDCIALKIDIDAEYEKISGLKDAFDALEKEAKEIGASLKKNEEKAKNDDGETLDENGETLDENEEKAKNDDGETLDENEEKAKNDSGETVEEYNKKIELYNGKVEELKVMEESYNKKSAPYQEMVAKLKKECEGQSYYEDDYAEMVKQMGRGM